MKRWIAGVLLALSLAFGLAVMSGAFTPPVALAGDEWYPEG